MKVVWTLQMIEYLKRNYENVRTYDIALKLNISVSSVYNKAFSLGLKKSIDFIKENSRENWKNNLKAQQNVYKKGRVPENKGKKQHEYMSQDSIERTKLTRFKKNHIPHNAKADGDEVIRKDSSGNQYLMIKLPQNRKLVYKHLWVWESANGNVPKGFNVVFKNGNTLDCRLENLEMLSNSELMSKNSMQRFPEELRQLIQLKGALKRQINKIENKNHG